MPAPETASGVGGSSTWCNDIGPCARARKEKGERWEVYRVGRREKGWDGMERGRLMTGFTYFIIIIFLLRFGSSFLPVRRITI